MQAADYFKELPIFADLSVDEIVDVLRIAKLVTFAPGEKLCTRGERADCMYVVEKGEGSVQLADESNPDGSVEVARIGPGEVIGELALVDHQVRSADVVANTVLSGYRIDRADFDSMRAELHPAVFKMLRRIAITVSDRLRDINDQISQEIARAEPRHSTPDGRPSLIPPPDNSSDAGRMSRAQVRLTAHTLSGRRAPTSGGDASERASDPASGKAQTKRRRRPPGKKRATEPKRAEQQPTREDTQGAQSERQSTGFWRSIRARIRGADV